MKLIPKSSGRALAALLLVLTIPACETLSAIFIPALPGILGRVYSELYRVLDDYQKAAATPPLSAAEARIFTQFQISRAASIADLASQLDGYVNPEELVRIRAVVAPHQPQLE